MKKLARLTALLLTGALLLVLTACGAAPLTPEQQAKQRKKENDIRKCEEEIAKLEEKDKQLDNEMALPENATNVAKLQELTKEKESISARLEELYEKWETLEAL